MLMHDMYDSLPLDEIVVSERISLFKSVILEQSFYILIVLLCAFVYSSSACVMVSTIYFYIYFHLLFLPCH